MSARDDKPKGGPSAPERSALLRAAYADVAPLRAGRTVHASRPVPPTRRGSAPVLGGGPGELGRFQPSAHASLAPWLAPVDDEGAAFLLLRSGVTKKQVLRGFREGGAVSLDLHGRTLAQAEQALERAYSTARGRGTRYLIVVHGKGLHSEAGVARLREAVRGWLEDGLLSSEVLALASLPELAGGLGATHVWLTRG